MYVNVTFVAAMPWSPFTPADNYDQEIPRICGPSTRGFGGHLRRQGPVSSLLNPICLASICSSRGTNSNIVTHHAEDGSGVGSAIIAGM